MPRWREKLFAGAGGLLPKIPLGSALPSSVTTSLWETFLRIRKPLLVKRGSHFLCGPLLHHEPVGSVEYLHASLVESLIWNLEAGVQKAYPRHPNSPRFYSPEELAAPPVSHPANV